MSSISKVLGEPSGFVVEALPLLLETPAEALEEVGRTEEMAAASPEEG
jgi:hypothetical protein